MEFFEAFSNLIGQDLKEMVEETRLSGRILGALNLAFLALIPKSLSPRSFNEFRPISLCNLAYKLISKIIAKRLKRGLSNGISKKQFVFFV